MHHEVVTVVDLLAELLNQKTRPKFAAEIWRKNTTSLRTDDLRPSSKRYQVREYVRLETAQKIKASQVDWNKVQIGHAGLSPAVKEFNNFPLEEIGQSILTGQPFFHCMGAAWQVFRAIL
jgi:hypothetical protein